MVVGVIAVLLIVANKPLAVIDAFANCFVIAPGANAMDVPLAVADPAESKTVAVPFPIVIDLPVAVTVARDRLTA